MGKIFPDFFLSQERIVRIIYSTQNINPKNNSLKSNFFNFVNNPETGKNELSCSRFEFESIESYRALGKHHEDPNYKRNYYGLACTVVSYVEKLEGYKFRFTPILNKNPKNYFHCDIYNGYSDFSQTGVANSADKNYRIELLKSKWNPYQDNGISFTKELIQPPLK